jgi:hypothetical protein
VTPAPPSPLVLLAGATLLVAVAWGCAAVVRATDGAGARPVDHSVPTPETAAGVWTWSARVACPHCDATNAVTDSYCAGCRAQLSPEWAGE